MKIFVEDVADAVHGRVRFRCGGRSVEGIWAGEGEPPVEVEVNVELEPPDEGLISSRLLPGPPLEPMGQEGEFVILRGRVEGVSPDGILEFRVASDVVLLEQHGQLADARPGMNLELRMPNIKIYPRDL
ncbi:hypothetical protein ACFT9M_19595 [Micromonospora purpureochromogenes]|uniref:hypothetical protein n=1 Tax=Micromonospora purpureochromogenes TaxID=47872 RepID=UPI00362A5E1C